MLGIFLAPKEDEWMTSWAYALARINDYDKIHEFYKRNLGYDFGNHENLGYVRNLDHICDRHGFDIFKILRNNTDLYVFGAFYPYGTLADISDRIIRNPGESHLMHCPKRFLDKWRRCPECENEDLKKYGRKIVHTKHQIYGVTACWKHGCRLSVETDSFAEPATEEAVKYARFLANLFDEPLECSIREVKDAVFARLAERGYKEPKEELPEEFGFKNVEAVTAFFRNRFGHMPGTFEKMADLLVRLFGEAAELKSCIRSEPKAELYGTFKDTVALSGNVEILRIEFPFARLRCLICGYEFTVHMKAYILGSWCPSCCNTITEEEFLKRRIRLAGNGEYEFLGIVKGKSKFRVRHLTCGSVTEPTIKEFIWNYRECLTCQHEMWKERIGMKNRNKSGIEFTITAYRNANDMDVITDNGVKLEHVTFDEFSSGTLGGNLIGEELKTHEEHHLGETFENNQGISGKIVAWRGYGDIGVEFENGYVARNRQYQAFKAGAIRCEEPGVVRRKDRVGQKLRHLCGLEMEIIRYSSVHDLDVRFEDGYVAEHVSYRTFKNGTVRHPEHNHRLKTERIGEEFLQNNGCVAVVVEYWSERDCLIRFKDDGAEIDHVSITRLKRGSVGKPFVPPIGKKFLLKSGDEVEIVAYGGINDVTVRWLDGWVREGVTMSALRKGMVKKK